MTDQTEGLPQLCNMNPKNQVQSSSIYGRDTIFLLEKRMPMSDPCFTLNIVIVGLASEVRTRIDNGRIQKTTGTAHARYRNKNFL